MHTFATVLGFATAGLVVIAFVKNRIAKTRENIRRARNAYKH